MSDEFVGVVPRFAIGTPGDPSPGMLQSIFAMVKPPGTVFLNAEMSKPGMQKMDISTARNELVRQFLVAHETFGLPEPLVWLLQVDGDAVLHPMTLHRLQSWRRAAVGALCVTRYRPYQPVVYRGLYRDKGNGVRSYLVQWQEVREWVAAHPQLMVAAGPALLEPAPEGSLHPVDWTGSHCFLVHRSVFERVGDPWFENAGDLRWGSGSDRIFFEKVAAAGFQPYVDFSVVAGHEAQMVLGMGDFMAWQAISVLEEDVEGEAVSPEFVGDDWVVRKADGWTEQSGEVGDG